VAPTVTPRKESTLLVRIERPGPVDAVYLTDSPEPLGFLGLTWLPEQIRIPPVEARVDLNEKEREVHLPFDSRWPNLTATIGVLTSGIPIGRVRVDAWELFDGEEIDQLIGGFVSKVSKNPKREKGKIALYVASPKTDFDGVVGLPVSPHCTWAYGGAGCQKFLTSDPDITVPLAFIASIDGNQVSIFDPDLRIVTKANGFPQPPRWWEGGFVEYDGVRVTFSEWEHGTNVFTTSSRLPDFWLGQIVHLQAGCYGSPQACFERANTGNFGGLGIKSPLRHPIFEDAVAE
jgi:hypothetical protein